MRAHKAHILSLVLLSILLFTACSPAIESRPTAVISYGTRNPLLITATPMPTFTPTPAPLGSANNPIVMGLIGKSPASTVRCAPRADRSAFRLSANERNGQVLSGLPNLRSFAAEATSTFSLAWAG